MLPILPQDKANHFVYGTAFALLTAVVSLLLGLPHPWAALAPTVASTAVGVGKELSDWWANKRAGAPVHTVEAMDAIYTSAGGWGFTAVLLL